MKRWNERQRAFALLAVSVLWLLVGVGQSLAIPTAPGSPQLPRISETAECAILSAVVIERGAKPTEHSLALEFTLCSHTSFQKTARADHAARFVLHDQIPFPTRLIYTLTTSSRL